MSRTSDQVHICRRVRRACPRRWLARTGRGSRLIAAVAVAALFAGGGLTSSAGAAAIDLAPYRAVYDLTLESAEARSGIASINGRLVVDFGGSRCDGYTQNTRLFSSIGLRRGKVNLLDSATTSWEAGNGSDYRFVYRRKLNKRLKERYAGRARRGANGEGGMVRFESPNGKTFALRPDVVFPTDHMKVLLKAAAAGRSFQRSLVFDGTEGTGISLITTVISRRIAPHTKPIAKDVAGARALDQMASWDMTLSYFPLNKRTIGDQQTGEQERDHAMRFRLFENGIAGDIALIFKNFRMSGKLSLLKILPLVKCE